MSDAFALTSPEVPEARRDWRAEEQNSRMELVSKMVMLREARLAPSPEVIVTAQFLIFMGLPISRITERSIQKSTRMADGSRVVVTFTAMDEGVDLPFGADVEVLHFLINRSIQSNSPFVPWRTAEEYIEWVGLRQGGRTLKQMRERFRRIAGMSITVQRTDSSDVETFRMPIIRASRVPKSIRRQDESTASVIAKAGKKSSEKLPRGLMFDEAFFKDFVDHNVPMLKALIVLVSERPQLQQYIGFLGWRSWAASSATLIPWANVREQLWHKDTNERRIKQRFKETIQALRIAWPELQSEARAKGLWIAPPLKGIQFIPSLPGPSRQIEPGGRAARRLSRLLPQGEKTGLFSVGEIVGN
jgi:hypothetical protein